MKNNTLVAISLLVVLAILSMLEIYFSLQLSLYSYDIDWIIEATQRLTALSYFTRITLLALLSTLVYIHVSDE